MNLKGYPSWAFANTIAVDADAVIEAAIDAFPDADTVPTLQKEHPKLTNKNN